MEKDSAISPRLPNCRTTSSRNSSAPGACRKVASVKRTASATSVGIALKSRVTMVAQHRRIDAASLGHVDGKLRAGAAILGHDGDDTRRKISGRRHVFTITADRLQLAEGQHRTRIGVDHLVHIAGVVVPGSLESGNLTAQKPL